MLLLLPLLLQFTTKISTEKETRMRREKRERGWEDRREGGEREIEHHGLNRIPREQTYINTFAAIFTPSLVASPFLIFLISIHPSFFFFCLSYFHSDPFFSSSSSFKWHRSEYCRKQNSSYCDTLLASWGNITATSLTITHAGRGRTDAIFFFFWNMGVYSSLKLLLFFFLLLSLPLSSLLVFSSHSIHLDHYQ